MGIVAVNSFTVGADTTLGSYTPDVGSSWASVNGELATVLAASGAVRGNSTTASAFYLNNTTPPGPEYVVRGRLAATTWADTANAALVARATSGGADFLVLQLFGGAATPGEIQLNKTGTNVGTHVISGYANNTFYDVQLRTRLVGAEVWMQVWVGPVQVIPATAGQWVIDSSGVYNATGKAGVRLRQNGRVDDFQIFDHSSLVIVPSATTTALGVATENLTLTTDTGLYNGDLACSITTNRSGAFSNAGSATLNTSNRSLIWTYTPSSSEALHTLTASAAGLTSGTAAVTVSSDDPSAYTFTAPATGYGPHSSASGLFTITLNAPATETTTFVLSSNRAGDTFRNAADSADITTVVFAPGETVKQFRLKSTAVVIQRTITVANDIGLAEQPGVAYEVLPQLVQPIGGNVKADYTITGTSAAPKISFFGRQHRHHDFNEGAVTAYRYWQWYFWLTGEGTYSPEFEFQVAGTRGSETAYWAPNGSESGYKPVFSLTSGETWVRFATSRDGSIASTGNANFNYFTHSSAMTVPTGGRLQVAYDIPRVITGWHGVEHLLNEYLNGPQASWFGPAMSSAARIALAGATNTGFTSDNESAIAAYTPTAPDGYSGTWNTVGLRGLIVGMCRADHASGKAAADGAPGIQRWPFYSVAVSNPALVPPGGESAKTDLVITLLLHSGEWVSMQTLAGQLNIFFSDTYLQTYHRVVLVFGNPNGLQNGHNRSSFVDYNASLDAYRDPNRSMNVTTSEVANQLKSSLLAACAGRRVAFFGDNHGQWGGEEYIYRASNSTAFQRWYAEYKMVEPDWAAENEVDTGFVKGGSTTAEWADAFLNAYISFIYEQNTVTSETDSSRVTDGAELMQAVSAALAKNQLIVTMPGSVVVGVPATATIKTAGGSVSAGWTPVLGSVTGAISGETVVMTWNASTTAPEWYATWTPSATTARTLTVTNTASLINPSDRAFAAAGNQQLAGNVAGGGAASGAVQLGISLAGAVLGVGLANAVAAHTVPLSAITLGVGSAAGSLAINVALGALVQGVGIAAGSLGVSSGNALAGNAPGQGAVNASLALTLNLAAGALGAGAAAGSMRLDVPLSAEVLAEAQIAGSLAMDVSLGGAIAGAGVVGGSLYQPNAVDLAADVEGSGGVIAGIQVRGVFLTATQALRMARPTAASLDARRFPAKDFEADVVTAFDFALEPGESIATALVSIDVATGGDSDPSTVLVGIPAIDGRSILQRVGGGVPRTTYYLRAKATLDSGRVLVAGGLLPVRKF